MPKRVHWKVLCVEYSRTGYVDELRVFGKAVYSRCGKVLRVFGMEIVIE